MKIHNYGNDYAFQRKQKLEEAVTPSEVKAQPIVEPETKVELHVADQVQTRGEGDMGDDSQKDRDTSVNAQEETQQIFSKGKKNGKTKQTEAGSI